MVPLNCSSFHKVNVEWAKKAYGEMINGRCAKKDQTCPQCNESVTAYGQYVSSLVQTRLKDMSEKDRSVMRANQMQREKEFGALGGKFIWIDGDWKSIGRGMVNRFVKLACFEESSAFAQIHFWGFDDGAFSINVCFREKFRGKCVEYLTSHDLTRGPKDDVVVGFTSKTPAEHLKLYYLIVKHNELPEEWRALFLRIVKAGKWN